MPLVRTDLREGNDLTGRAAAVTGGNGDIGLGMPRGLAWAGASVVIAGRDTAKNAKATAELREAYRARGYRVVAVARTTRPLGDPDILAVAGDITDPATAERAVLGGLAHVGRIDTLVNNARPAAIPWRRKAAWRPPRKAGGRMRARTSSGATARLQARPHATDIQRGGLAPVQGVCLLSASARPGPHRRYLRASAGRASAARAPWRRSYGEISTGPHQADRRGGGSNGLHH
ncbi:MAG TPA: SDR family NAD(P)-dependent oxidoreductase [Crenalkalicoccus sp.]|nr:SDR family NAD(P)-dependent oxidoreductase [Crenalkalicoccus sp.]